jgi:hypothetical protein
VLDGDRISVAAGDQKGVDDLAANVGLLSKYSRELVLDNVRDALEMFSNERVVFACDVNRSKRRCVVSGANSRVPFVFESRLSLESRVKRTLDQRSGLSCREGVTICSTHFRTSIHSLWSLSSPAQINWTSLRLSQARVSFACSSLSLFGPPCFVLPTSDVCSDWKAESRSSVAMAGLACCCSRAWACP